MIAPGSPECHQLMYALAAASVFGSVVLAEIAVPADQPRKPSGGAA